MTIDERFERIERLRPAEAEQRRKDRAEDRQLWRDTQRQINDLSVRINDLTLKVAETNDTVARLAEESREADRRLGERIDKLVSAIGTFLTKQSS